MNCFCGKKPKKELIIQKQNQEEEKSTNKE